MKNIEELDHPALANHKADVAFILAALNALIASNNLDQKWPKKFPQQLTLSAFSKYKLTRNEKIPTLTKELRLEFKKKYNGFTWELTIWYSFSDHARQQVQIEELRLTKRLLEATYFKPKN